jgi:ABC-2 type transport system permease protein
MRFYRSELRLVFGRRRNQALLVLLAAVPIFIGVVLKINGGPTRGDGPAFLTDVTHNGLFLVFTSLSLLLGFLLPLVVGAVSGDTVAGEAGAGTLRYLLAVPVGRTRLLAVKLAGAFTFAGAAVALVGAVALATGAALFPVGDVTLLSGDAVPFSDGLGRGALIVLYVALSMFGLCALGLFVSTLTEVGIAAMIATVVLAVASEILDAIPQLHAIHPFLLTHHWNDFGELLRRDPRPGWILGGLAVQLGYVLIAGSLAWTRFSGADVTS